MTTYISILRGINVGGNRKILMADLKNIYSDLKFKNIRTYIQSGNVIFDSPNTNENSIIEETLQNAIHNTYGFEVKVIVRTNKELIDIFNNNPFLSNDNLDLKKLYLSFLKEEPSKDKLLNISQIDTSPDLYNISGKDIFIYCNSKFSDCKITNLFFEKQLKVPVTTRNWNTISKLHQMIIDK